MSNVSGGPLQDPDAIKEALARQLCSPVLWERSIRHCLAEGICDFLEPGPGSILGGLVRRIARDAKVETDVLGIEHPESLD